MARASTLADGGGAIFQRIIPFRGVIANPPKSEGMGRDIIAPADRAVCVITINQLADAAGQEGDEAQTISSLCLFLSGVSRVTGTNGSLS